MQLAKTTKPEQPIHNFDQWHRYIVATRFEVENKNLLNQAKELIYKPLNIKS